MSIAESNPYESPRSPQSDTPGIVCTFCNKVSADGPLVQAPGQEVFICSRCAQIVVDEVNNHRGNSLLSVLLSLLFGGCLVILVLANWFLWDDEAEVGWVTSLIGLACGLFYIVRSVVGWRARWRRAK